MKTPLSPSSPFSLVSALCRPEVTRTLSLGAQIVAVALTTAWLSRLLVDLSGTALRLPPPWGQSVQTVMPLFGVGVFTFTRHLTHQFRERYLVRALKNPDWAGIPTKARPTKQERLDGARERAQARSRTMATGFGALVFTVALVAAFAYNRLHERCAWGFTVPVHEHADQQGCWNWYWAEWGDSRSFPCDRDEQAERLASLDDKLPRFLDRESNTIYLSRKMPGDIRALLERYGDGDADAGRWTLLRSEHAAPMRLIDAIMKSPTYAGLLAATQRDFYLLHAIVIALLSLAVGVLFAPAPRIAAELLEALHS